MQKNDDWLPVQGNNMSHALHSRITFLHCHCVKFSIRYRGRKKKKALPSCTDLACIVAFYKYIVREILRNFQVQFSQSFSDTLHLNFEKVRNCLFWRYRFNPFTIYILHSLNKISIDSVRYISELYKLKTRVITTTTSPSLCHLLLQRT